MVEKINKAGIEFRPHFKTHQSLKIGHWFREEGVSSITVSSVKMARYFARDGWRDISIAFPVNLREIEALNELAREIRLHILIADAEVVPYLQSHLTCPVEAWIEIDTGYKRSGIPAESNNEIEILLEQTEQSENLHLQGFLSHTGHAYHAGSPHQVIRFFEDARHKLSVLKKHFRTRYPNLKISLGDTPSASIADNFKDIDELRPGNFVFYDLMQQTLGACEQEQIAIALAAPVVAKYPARNEIVLYGGGVHLSKEELVLPDGRRIYGQVLKLTEKGWIQTGEDDYMVSLSQEHGIAQVGNTLMSSVRAGDLVAILPVHSCLTAHLMKSYLGLEGNRYDHMEGTV